jgi:prevent-host-death family protein
MIQASIAETKAHLSEYLALVDINKEEIAVTKRGKQVAYIVPIEHYKKTQTDVAPTLSLKQIDAYDSSLNVFVGIINKDKIDENPKKSRAEYLIGKNI